MADIDKLQPITVQHAWFVGTKKIFRYTVYDEDGNLTDPSGWLLAWYLRTNKTSTEVLITKDSNTDITVSDQKALVSIFPADTDGFEPATYAYQLWRVDPGLEDVLAYGPAILQR